MPFPSPSSPQSCAVDDVAAAFQPAAHAMSEFMYRFSSPGSPIARHRRMVQGSTFGEGLSRYRTYFCWSSFRFMDLGKPATFNPPIALVRGS